MKANRLQKLEKLCIKRYKPVTVNSMLIAINLFLRFLNLPDYCVKLTKIQRKIFCRSERELSYREYSQLLDCEKDTPISLMIQTICGTGIRVSELAYITVEAVKNGQAIVHNKNKTRVIFIPCALRKILLQYVKKTSRKADPIFITKYGNPPNRSNIWRQMKALCKKANVAPEKVFPHNLRHLFARTFYNKTKDIVKLADLLGHSNVETTRIYTMSSGKEHLHALNSLNLVC